MAKFLPLVVKLGGSLHASPERADWIAALGRYPRPVVLVCGGGPFADAVRATQPVMGYSEQTAHAMALLAMEQYALALENLHDGLRLASSLEEFSAAHARGAIALWRPSRMVAEAQDIAPSWKVTSDSLAAWLAHRLSAEALLVIKSVDIGADLVLHDVAAAGVVDPAFPAYVGRLPVFIAGPQALREASQLFARGELPGQRVDSASRKIAS